MVGHSMGNIVLQHVAVAAPKLVASLALFGPLIVPPDAARSAIRARGEKAKHEGAAGMHEITLALLNASISADTRTRLPLAVAFVRESLMRQDPDGYARSCFALADAPAAAVEQIEAPVLLVTGDEDVVAPPQAVRAMAEKLHRARSVRVVVLPQLRPLDAGGAARGVRARVARVLGGAAVMWMFSLREVWARRGGRYPAGAPDCGGRPCRPTPLRCSGRGRAAKLASLPAVVPLGQSPRVRSGSARSRAPTPALRFSPPHKSPPPGTAHRAATLVAVRRRMPRWCRQSRGWVCDGSDIVRRRASAGASWPRARSARFVL